MQNNRQADDQTRNNDEYRMQDESSIRNDEIADHVPREAQEIDLNGQRDNVKPTTWHNKLV